jgi:hexosaminidase
MLCYALSILHFHDESCPIKCRPSQSTTLARFRYRACISTSLDFPTVEFVKKFIDLMSQYKLNYFHCISPDGPGLADRDQEVSEVDRDRIQAPETVKERNLTLHSVTEFRNERFYTQEQIKRRHRLCEGAAHNVVPEIELPGMHRRRSRQYPNSAARRIISTKFKRRGEIFKEVYCRPDETFQVSRRRAR